MKAVSKTVIRSVDPKSPADKAGIKPGEALKQVNGHPIVDVLDYKYHTYDPVLTLVLEQDGSPWILGWDSQHNCENTYALAPGNPLRIFRDNNSKKLILVINIIIRINMVFNEKELLRKRGLWKT